MSKELWELHLILLPISGLRVLGYEYKCMCSLIDRTNFTISASEPSNPSKWVKIAFLAEGRGKSTVILNITFLISNLSFRQTGTSIPSPPIIFTKIGWVGGCPLLSFTQKKPNNPHMSRRERERKKSFPNIRKQWAGLEPATLRFAVRCLVH